MAFCMGVVHHLPKKPVMQEVTRRERERERERERGREGERERERERRTHLKWFLKRSNSRLRRSRSYASKTVFFSQAKTQPWVRLFLRFEAASETLARILGLNPNHKNPRSCNKMFAFVVFCPTFATSVQEKHQTPSWPCETTFAENA